MTFLGGLLIFARKPMLYVVFLEFSFITMMVRGKYEF